MDLDETYIFLAQSGMFVPLVLIHCTHTLLFRAEDWNLAHPLAVCRLLVERRGDTLVLEFTKESNSNEGTIVGGFDSSIKNPIFAQAVVDCSVPIFNANDKSQQQQQQVIQHWLEGTVDSSRYFTLRILAPNGRDEALIGFGFRDRDPAIDLRESMQHYENAMRREAAAVIDSKNSENNNSDSCSQPRFVIPKLADGEKIRVSIGKDSSGSSIVIPRKVGEATMGINATRPTLLMKKPPPSAADESVSDPAFADEINFENISAADNVASASLMKTVSKDMASLTVESASTTATSTSDLTTNQTSVLLHDDEDDDWEAEFVSANEPEKINLDE